jgi:endonuclease YncB( thermonuclease family)
MAAPVPALADTTGRANVIDGDTIEVRGERIRLDAIGR